MSDLIPLKKEKESVLCSICYECVKKHNSTTTICGHRFHSTCLFKCLNKNIENCPLCKKHLYKRQLNMNELYEECKNEIFNFDTFVYLINTIEIKNLDKCIIDLSKYEVSYEENEDPFQNFEINFGTKINDVLEKN